MNELARELAVELRPGDRVLLEGTLGAGKTTFARALLYGLGVIQPPEGSPTFAIAHEYEAPRAPVIHIDFYRLRSEEEIEDSGIPSYFWERNAIVICEWLSAWPEFERAVLVNEAGGAVSGRVWRVWLSMVPDQGQNEVSELPASRDLRVEIS